MTEFDTWELESGCTDECAVHKSSVLCFYCPKHSVFACGNCLVEFHGDCDTEFVPEAARKYAESEEVENLKEELKGFEQELDSAQDDPSEKAIADIWKFRAELNEYLDKKEMELVTKIKELQQENNKCIVNKEESNSEYKNIKTNLEELKAMASEIAGQNIQFYKISKHNTAPAESFKLLKGRFTSWLQQSKTQGCVFQRNPNIVNVMNSNENFATLLDLVDLKSEPKRNVLVGNDRQWSENVSESANINDDTDIERLGATGYQMPDTENAKVPEPSKYASLFDVSTLVRGDIQQLEDIDVQSTEDRRVKCGITGCDLLSDKLLIMADMDQKAVKLCEVQYARRVISRLPLPYAPFDVAAISDHEAVVTIPFEKIIHFITVNKENMLVLGNRLNVRDSCFGVAYNRGKLVVSFCSPGKIQIMDLNGQVVNTIATNSSGVRLFEWPRYVTVTDDSFVNDEAVEAIYVSDEFTKTVSKLSLKGDVEFTHTEEHRIWTFVPRGIASFGNDHILVCYNYHGESQIHIMSKHGKVNRTLLRNYMYGRTPQAIRFCPVNKRVYLSHNGDSFSHISSYNRIKVYGF